MMLDTVYAACQLCTAARHLRITAHLRSEPLVHGNHATHER